MPFLPEYLFEHYKSLESRIKARLEEFKKVPEDLYFYELCFCLCTPQSKAKNALLVTDLLKEKDYFNNPFAIEQILRNPSNYIRFHNTKAERIFQARLDFEQIKRILKSEKDNYSKRNLIKSTVVGFGMKESSHYLRNIGYEGLAILDRHILKHLVLCGVLPSFPKISSVNEYLDIENKFLGFADSINIPIDELDLLFWSYETGEILK